MGHLMSPERDEAEVRSVLDAATLPADVLGYQLRLGEFEGGLALWITFHTSIPDDAPVAELRVAAARLNDFANTVQTAIMRVVPDRFPYVAFAASH